MRPGRRNRVGSKIAFYVVVRLDGSVPTVREIGVLRRAFPFLREMSIAEAMALVRQDGKPRLKKGEFQHECGFKDEAEEMARVCREGGLDAYVI